MGAYVEPERWNDKAKESAERAAKLRKDVAEGKDAQRYNYVFGTHSKTGRDNYAAINKELNLKEEEAEALDQRALDQYPKGTTMGGMTSRNRAEHGKPVDLPDAQTGKKKGGMVKKMASGGMTASKRADGIASRGKTKCKMY
jgi:hypothetical protein